MKKSLIALATLVAFAGAASAQSSVTLGGFVDLGVGKATFSDDKGIIDGAGSGGSRLNFNAVEDLGGGLKAIAGFEHRFEPDTGSQSRNADKTNQAFWNGYSFVGLQGGFGTVRIGRHYTSAFLNVQNQVDPFAGDTVATLRQASMQITPAKVRFANGIGYGITMGGLGLYADISEKGLDNNNGAAQLATNVNKPWSVAATYGAGPLWFGVSHENPGGKNDKLTNLGARYTMGGLTLRAGMASGTNNDNAKVKGYLLGANYMMGSGNFKIGYATNKTSGYTAAADLFKNKTNNKRFAVGYQYNLSKRTFLYTDFVRDSATQYNATGVEQDVSKTGYDFGIRHNF